MYYTVYSCVLCFCLLCVLAYCVCVCVCVVLFVCFCLFVFLWATLPEIKWMIMMMMMINNASDQVRCDAWTDSAFHPSWGREVSSSFHRIVTRLRKVIWKQATLPPLVDPKHHNKPQLRRFMHFCTAMPHWSQWGAPHLPPILLLPVDWSNPTTCLIPGPIRPTIPNRIHIRSTVLPQCNGQTHRHTHTGRPTDGWRKCLMTIGHFRSTESATA